MVLGDDTSVDRGSDRAGYLRRGEPLIGRSASVDLEDVLRTNPLIDVVDLDGAGHRLYLGRDPIDQLIQDVRIRSPNRDLDRLAAKSAETEGVRELHVERGSGNTLRQRLAKLVGDLA